MFKNSNFYYILFISFLILSSCTSEEDDFDDTTDFPSADQFDSAVLVDWFNLIKVLTTETDGYTPPVAARAFGYTTIALYEAIQVGSNDKISLSGKLNGLNIETGYEQGSPYHWPTVANTTLANMTKYFYMNASVDNVTSILNLEASYKEQFLTQINDEVIFRSIEFANQISGKIVLWSSNDGGYGAQFNNFPSDYVPLSGIEFWKPTAPNQKALLPYWGNNRHLYRLTQVMLC